MHPELQMRWEKLQNSKHVLEVILARNTADVYAQPTDGWSMAQVAEHLLASEGGTLGYMKKKSSSGWHALEDATNEHHAKSVAINARLESRERYKAPEILPEPTNKIAINELFLEWNALRAELHAFLSAIGHGYLNKLVFRQPAAGMLTILHTLEFMDAHLRHHLPQLERIELSLK
jgi:hypothetical protein